MFADSSFDRHICRFICAKIKRGNPDIMLKTQKLRSGEVDMCNGPLFSKIIVFFIPVMLSNMLQLLYNAADQVVVGQFAGSDALAAVGSTSSLFNLIVSIIIGLSVGTSSVVAIHFGAGNSNSVSRSVHTSMLLAVICGLIIGAIGFFFSRPLLILMDTQPDVLDNSVLYMQILSVGLPLVAIYNFGSAILRAIGDTKRPMYFLIISGIINIIFNLFFVIVFKMSVAGVAIATVISQAISGAMTVICLMKSKGSYKFCFSRLKLHKTESLQIIRIGIPASIQSSMFSISNMIIQTGINSINKAAVSGCTAATNIDGIIYQAMNSLYHAALSFCGQNYGAKKYGRIMKSFLYCSLIVTVVGLIVGTLAFIFDDLLLSIFIKDDPEAIAYGKERLMITCIPYFLCGLMEVSCGALRSLNHPVSSLVNSILGACVFRIIWIYTVFKASPSVYSLFWSYPLSWALTTAMHVTLFLFFFFRMKKRDSYLAAHEHEGENYKASA